MEDITIPGWAILLIPVLIAWMLWLTREIYAQSKINALTAQKQDTMSGVLNNLCIKLDTFIHQEMSFLKTVVKVVDK